MRQVNDATDRRAGRRNAPRLTVQAVLLLAGMCVIMTPAKSLAQLDWKNSGSGDWGGARSAMAERGITFAFINDTYFLYNTTGGVSTGGVVNNRIVAELFFDLESLIGLKGSGIMVSGSYTVGSGDINDKVGAIIGGGTINRPDQVRLYELYWTQSWADKQVNLKAGRVGLGPLEWGYSIPAYDFMSSGYNSSPGAFFINQPGTTLAEPIATWGARILIEPKDKDYNFRFGVFNAWPRDLGLTDGGVDFSMHPDSALFVISEFAYQLNQDPEDQGLPGNYKIGWMYDTGPFTLLDDSNVSKRGNFGMYVMFDQMLFRERPEVTPPDHPANWKGGRRRVHPTDQGLTFFGSFVLNPDESINFAPYWASAGFSDKGLFRGRDADRTAMAFYYGFLSPDSGADYEFMLEVFHMFQVRPWIQMGPDIQWVVNPGGEGAPNAFVASFQMTFHL